MRYTAPRARYRHVDRMLTSAALVLLAAIPTVAQQTIVKARGAPLFYWSVDVGTATLSGLVQGRFRSVPVQRALLGGVVGGSLMYAGQRLVGTGRPGLRFAGLQSVAVGASVTRNLARGRGALDELTFPLFPLYIQVNQRESPRWRARLSVVALAGVVKTVREFHVAPDWQESFLAGLPVFSVPANRLGPCDQYVARSGQCLSGVLGHHVIGAVAYAARPELTTVRDILTHELGHSAQDVRDVVLHAVPASDLLLQTSVPGRWLSRFLVVDVVLPLNVASRVVGPPAGDPACRDLSTFYECETEAMKPALP